MTVLVDIVQLCLCPPDGAPDDVGAVADAALVWDAGRIVWAGRRLDLPADYADAERRSAGGRLVVPGLVDSHTHLAFGGDRTGEFVERLAGTPYLDIARRGGGILSTVRATRAASEPALVSRARGWLDVMLLRGVTTVEAKSGYGLTLADEIKQLGVYRRLAAEGPQRLVATVLGAHTVPPEFASDRAGYLRLLTDDLLPAVAHDGLAVFCDAFVEDTAFHPDEARVYFDAARHLGLVPKLHADQLSDTGGARLAAEAGAASADHLEFISDAGIRALAASTTVAVSLPLATLTLGVPPLPARRLIAAGVPVAVATDFNPGSAPQPDLPLAMWAACVRQRMTPAEALRGATCVAAQALLLDGVGTLVPGAHADLCIVDAPSLDAWMYHGPGTPIAETVIGGQSAWTR